MQPSEKHKFYYMKDMTPDEAMFIKCFDSRSQGQPGGRQELRHGLPTPHLLILRPRRHERERKHRSQVPHLLRLAE